MPGTSLVTTIFCGSQLFISMDWMFVSPQNPYVEALTPNVMVFGDGALEKQLGLEGIMIMEPSWWD